MLLPQRNNHSRVIRMPRRAAEMLKNRRRHRPIEAMQLRIPLRPTQNLELGAVRLEGMDRPNKKATRVSNPLTHSHTSDQPTNPERERESTHEA